MRTKFIRGLAAVAKVLASVAAVGSLPAVQFLPEKYLIPALVAIGVISTTKDFLITVGDWLDDGKKNGSFTIPLAILGGLCLLALASCSTSPTGEKTFLGLTQDGWIITGKAAGQSAVQAGLPVALSERAKTAAKEPVSVQP